MKEQFNLKPISREAIPRAIEKAERYRLINESWAAESICRDILDIDPENQQVLVILVLALTDQVASGHATVMKTVREIASERSGQAHILRGGMGSGGMAYDALKDAMAWYEKAEAIRPAGNDDAILRWNTCARLITSNSQLTPHVESAYEPALED